MKKVYLLLITFLAFSLCFAQRSDQFNSAAKNVPFSWTLFGVTITGTYSEGCLKSKVVNGTSIFFGLVSWGGSTEISCTPGCSICRIETIISVNKMSVVVKESGEKCFENANTPMGVTPVFVGVKDGALTFAVDIDQTAENQKDSYSGEFYELSSSFILDPGAVKGLNLSGSKDDMGYIIPAGSYPLYRDGKIFYWTFFPKN